MASLAWQIARVVMLYYQEYQWLPVHGASRFNAYIEPKTRLRKQVHWELEMRFVATGAIWRRVLSYHRPTVWLILHGFQPETRSWQDLEQVSFWNLEEERESVQMKAGWLNASVSGKWPGNVHPHPSVARCGWRVVGREGAWFTVEMAGFASGSPIQRPQREERVLVTAEGVEEREETDAEFWKKHSTFYLVEAVPFGTVTVQVPRNSRDVEAHALVRARELIGVGEPEHIEVTDFSKWARSSECLHDDIYVKLHFNGFYED